MPTSFQTQVAEATRSSPVGGNLFHQFAHRCAARTNILAIPIHGSPDFSGSPVSGVWVIWTHRPFGYPGPTHQRPTAPKTHRTSRVDSELHAATDRGALSRAAESAPRPLP